MTTRAEHLAFCKERALRELAYYQIHEPDRACANAFASMGSDMSKHPETDCPKLMQLGMTMLMGGMLDTPDAMRRWIEGFN